MQMVAGQIWGQRWYQEYLNHRLVQGIAYELVRGWAGVLLVADPVLGEQTPD